MLLQGDQDGDEQAASKAYEGGILSDNGSKAYLLARRTGDESANALIAPRFYRRVGMATGISCPVAGWSLRLLA